MIQSVFVYIPISQPHGSDSDQYSPTYGITLYCNQLEYV